MIYKTGGGKRVYMYFFTSVKNICGLQGKRITFACEFQYFIIMMYLLLISVLVKKLQHFIISFFVEIVEAKHDVCM